MTDTDLQDFIACYNPQNRYQRIETWSEENPEGRWRKYPVKEIKPVWIFSGLRISLLLI